MQLNNSEQKLIRRIVDRKTDLAKYRSKSEKYEKCLERELQEELLDFTKYRREVLNVIGSNAEIDFPRKLIGSKKVVDEDEDSAESTNDVLISLWDRLNQRDAIAKKQWKHLSKAEIAKPLDYSSNRIASFSRAFKEYDKFQSKHKDMVKGDLQLKDQMTSTKEKKDIIRLQASKCYESLLKTSNKDLKLYGLVVILKEMLEMEFDISKLSFPNYAMDQAGFNILVQ